MFQYSVAVPGNTTSSGFWRQSRCEILRFIVIYFATVTQEPKLDVGVIFYEGELGGR